MRSASSNPKGGEAVENQNSNNSSPSHRKTRTRMPRRPTVGAGDEEERTLLQNEEGPSSVDLTLEEEQEEKENAATTEEGHSGVKGENVGTPDNRPFTRKQKLTFAGFALVGVSDYMLFSILAPFFPVEAQKKDVSVSVSGLVFGVYALVSFVACPICGKYIAQIGPKFMFFSGTFLGAGCNILFGVLDGIENTQTFIIYCFVLRSFEAIGASASVTASMAMVATVFPNNVAQMTGLLEMFSGLGLMIGPALGGALYQVGGYRLPFLVLGGLDFTILFLTMLIIPDMPPSGPESQPGSLLRLLMIPVAWPLSLAIVIASSALTFLDPTLSLHLETFGVSTSIAGVLFLLIGGLYALTMPIFGYLADKQGRTRLMTLLGFYLMGLSYLLIGPSPLLKLPHYLWIVILAMSLSGLSVACACMPVFLDMLTSARWYGFPDDMSTNGLVSGVFGGCFSLGSFIGPVIGGVLKDHVGFTWASTYIAGSCFAFILIFGPFCIWEYQWGKGRRKPWRYFGEPNTDRNINTDTAIPNDGSPASMSQNPTPDTTAPSCNADPASLSQYPTPATTAPSCNADPASSQYPTPATTVPSCNADPASSQYPTPATTAPSCNADPASSQYPTPATTAPLCNADPASLSQYPTPATTAPLCNADPASMSHYPTPATTALSCNADPASSQYPTPATTAPLCNADPASMSQYPTPDTTALSCNADPASMSQYPTPATTVPDDDTYSIPATEKGLFVDQLSDTEPLVINT